MTKTNTINHISDQALTVLVDTSKTVWADKPTIVNLQDVLNTIDIIAIQDKVATTEAYGLVKIAKDDDLDRLVGTGAVVTSKQLIEFSGKPRASKTVYGTTKYATTAEVTAGTSDVTTITPLEFKKNMDGRIPTRDTGGLVKLSHQSMVIPGIDDATAMTPKLVKFAIDSLVPTVAIASESNTGTVTLSSVAITQAGTIRNGYAVSPYSFVNTNASEIKYGTVRLATGNEANNSSLNDKIAISPSSLHKVTSTTSRRGLVQLATDAEVKSRIDATKSVTPKSLQYYYDLIDDLSRRLGELNNQVNSFEGVPVGAIIPMPTSNPRNNLLLPCDGTWYEKARYPRLYEILGGDFSVSATHFMVPDYRGYFLRGRDSTGSIDNEGGWRKFRDPQGDAIRNITGSYGSHALRDGWHDGALFQRGWWLYTSYNGNNHKAGMNLEFDASRVVPTAPENRPKNKIVTYFIVAG